MLGDLQQTGQPIDNCKKKTIRWGRNKVAISLFYVTVLLTATQQTNKQSANNLCFNCVIYAEIFFHRFNKSQEIDRFC